jgi:hypothetical protein
MKRGLRLFRWVAPIGAAATIVFGGVLLHSLAPERQPDFWIAVYSSLLVGVMAGLIVTGVQAWQDTSDADLRAANEEAESRSRILALVRSELEDNATAINLLAGTLRDEELIEAAVKSPLRSDFWNAALASGETKHIADPALLNSIVAAYLRVRIADEWVIRTSDAWGGPGRAIPVRLADRREMNGFSAIVFHARGRPRWCSASTVNAQG